MLIQLVSGVMTATVEIDLDAAYDAADQISATIKTAADQARRARSGLVVPQLAAPNGHRLAGGHG